jgi:hypothetical protein
MFVLAEQTPQIDRLLIYFHTLKSIKCHMHMADKHKMADKLKCHIIIGLISAKRVDSIKSNIISGPDKDPIASSGQ